MVNLMSFDNLKKEKIALFLITIILISTFVFGQTISTTLPRSNPGHPIGQVDCGTGTTQDPYRRCDTTGPAGNTPNGIIDSADQAELALSLLYS